MDHVRKVVRLGGGAPTGRGVRVAVLDSGIDHEHPDFESCLDRAKSANIVSSFRGGLMDTNGHGTHIAGVIAGSGALGGKDRRGIAPDASLIVLRVASGLTCSDHDFATAVEMAIDEKVDVLNYSFGGRAGNFTPPWTWGPGSLFDQGIELAFDAGILCVVAAGNFGPHQGSISRPGGVPKALSVGALDATVTPFRVATNSSRGPYRFRYADTTSRGLSFVPGDAVTEIQKPDVVAPGVDVVAPRSGYSDHQALVPVGEPWFFDPLDENSPYCYMSGSSQATAVVSGLACLALERLRELGADLGESPPAVLHRLLSISTLPLKEGTPLDYGHGMVQWPKLAATIDDFVKDPRFRETVINGGKLSAS